MEEIEFDSTDETKISHSGITFIHDGVNYQIEELNIDNCQIDLEKLDSGKYKMKVSSKTV